MNQPLPATVPGRDGASASGPTPLRSTAAVPDWAFLTGDIDLGRVAVGDPTSGARPAEPITPGATGANVSDLGAWRRGDAPFDTIVVRHPDTDTVHLATTALADTGTIRLERVGRGQRHRLTTLLAAAGFDVRAWWHRPDLDATWAIVGLDRPAAASTILRGVAGRHRRGGPEALLARSGLARWLAGSVAFTATRSTTTPMSASDPTMPVDALLTPRFQSSRAVLGISMTTPGDRIASVTKIARSRHDEATIRWEAEALQSFRDQSPDPLAAPTTHHLAPRQGRLVLVEAGAEGHPLDRRQVRRDPTAALAAGTVWLERVPTAGTSTPHDDGRAVALIDAAVTAIARLDGRRAEVRIDAVARADRLLQGLRRQSVTVVFEHGDLSHPNVFRRRDGGLTVVDWERARPDGFPLHDLSLFTAYVVESAVRPRNDGELVIALSDACGPAGWARPVLDRHLDTMGIERADVALLELAAWTRYVAALAATPTRLEQVAPHRAEVLWLDALRRAEEARS